MRRDRVDVLVDHGATVIDAELVEQERDLQRLAGEDLVIRVQVPELALEGPERLLARRVHELLVGLAGLSLVGGVAAALAAFASVKFLMRYFETKTLTPFAIYCFVFGAAMLVRFA